MPVVVNEHGQLIGTVSPDSFTYRCTLCGYSRKQGAFKTEELAKKAFDKHMATAHSTSPTVKRRGYYDSPSPFESLQPRRLASKRR